MPDEQRYAPGGDSQAIHRIAKERYGGLAGLFDAHGWPERNDRMMPAVQGHVAASYGSVREFERAHDSAALTPPLDAINADPPNVWLKSFYGFDPGRWGFVGFSQQQTRTSFIRRSQPGCLLVIYGASKAAPELKGRIIGIQQQSHDVGPAERFMSPAAWAEKQANPDRRDKWNHAVGAMRAWVVTPETRVSVEKFAPDTYSVGKSQTIGAQGMQMTVAEAKRILDLDLVEVPVFGDAGDIASVAAPAGEALKPSKAGPVSGSPYTVREAEGPKHLYVLRLEGDADAFLGTSAHGHMIIKVGFSRSPATRCQDHNRALPRGAFRWAIHRSTFEDGRAPFPTSRHAIAGEKVMKDLFDKRGKSLGGEFFLSDRSIVEAVWTDAILAAEAWGTK